MSTKRPDGATRALPLRSTSTGHRNVQVGWPEATRCVTAFGLALLWPKRPLPTQSGHPGCLIPGRKLPSLDSQGLPGYVVPTTKAD